MSKIKIVGHASGSGILTIAAPNTNTDRTITIPDVTGTLLDSGSTLDATKLTGTIPNFTSTGIDDNADAIAITIDSSENVGIGVTPESWLSIIRALQIGGNGSLSCDTSAGAGKTLSLGNNVYHDGARKYISTDEATRYDQNDGKHTFFVSPSGTADSAISWTTAMTIDNSGNVGIGVTPESNWKSTFTALQVGGMGSITGDTAESAGNQFTLVNNAYISDATSWTYKMTDEASFYQQADGQHQWRVAPSGTADSAISWTTAMVINNSGNVGIGGTPESGTSSDVSELDMGLMSLSIWKGETQANDSASYGYNCYKTGGSTYKAKKSSQGGDWRPAVYEQIYGKHIFRVASSATADSAISFTNAMTILNNGQLLIGATTTSGMSNGTSNYGFSLSGGGQITSATNNDTNAIFNMSNGSNEHHVLFRSNGSTTGYISTNGSSVAYNTGSDYRLKENVDYTWDATTRLKQLKPARFNFISDDTNTLVDGFIAHEVSSVVPEAISGEKDAMMDEEYEVTPAVMDGETVVTEAVMGTRSVPDYQGIDQSKLVPLLVKTIQELEARITTLEG